jgi:hypothetical protein
MTAVSIGGTSADIMRPATRVLLAVTAAGVMVLWPMVRLSQLPDDHPFAGIVQDLVVVLIPTQAVIWPQALGWLGRWPVGVVAAVAALLAAWGVLAGGLLAIAQVLHQRAAAGYGRFTPWVWTLAFIALAVGGAIVPMFESVGLQDADLSPRGFRAGWMLSPITGVYETTRDRSWTGTSASVTAGHWWSIGVAAVAAVALWLAAAGIARGMRRPAGLH